MSLDSEVRKRTEMNGEIGSEQDGNLISSENTVKTTTSLKDNRKWLILNTHLNAAIYSSCFWVQIGVLPLVQGLIVGVLSRRFSEAILLRSAICVIALAYALLYMVTDIYQFCIVIIPMVIGGTTLNVITTSAMTKSVAINKTGAVLGLSMATNSLIRTVSPTLGSIMYKNYGWPSFGVLGLVVNAAVASFLFLHGKNSF